MCPPTATGLYIHMVEHAAPGQKVQLVDHAEVSRAVVGFPLINDRKGQCSGVQLLDSVCVSDGALQARERLAIDGELTGRAKHMQRCRLLRRSCTRDEQESQQEDTIPSCV